MNDRVKYCIAERKSENLKYRYMKKTCRVDDMRTESVKLVRLKNISIYV